MLSGPYPVSSSVFHPTGGNSEIADTFLAEKWVVNGNWDLLCGKATTALHSVIGSMIRIV